MSHVRVGIDMDGVLADFNTPFIALIEKHSGIKLPPVSDTFPNTWHYHQAAGMEKSRENAMWKEIQSTPGFWYNLPVLAPAKPFMSALHALCMDRNGNETDNMDIYFITNRQGINVKEDTEDFITIKFNFAPVVPTVLISQEKGTAAKALNLTHYIDDKVENCQDVVRDAPSTCCYLYDQPWNRHMQVEGTTRITSLMTFYQDIESAFLS